VSSADQATEPPQFDRRRLTLLLVPIGVLVVMANVGTALAPTLVNNHPVWLIMLDSRNRHLLLVVAADIDPLPYFVIGFFRLIASDPLFFLLGRWYGEGALKWLEHKAGTGATRQLRWVERVFGKIGAPLVALMPNNLVCLFAGASGMRPRVFWTLNILGTIGRLIFIWFLGRALEEPLGYVLDFIQRYQWPLLGLSVAIVVFQAGRAQARGEIEPIDKIEDEIEAETLAVTESRPAEQEAPPVAPAGEPGEEVR
jgi:membrane protein DedA with SNARE-associated domain